MYPYFLSLLLVIISILLCRQKGHIQLAFLSCFIWLVLFAGLRDEGVDRDYNVYIQGYYDVSSPIEEYFDGRASFVNEPAINIIASVSKYFFDSTIVFFLVFSFLGVGLKFLSIRKYSPFLLLSVLIYFSKYYFFNEFTQIRMGVAVGFFLFSIQYIVSRNLLKFLSLIFIGGLFHYSVLLVIPLYFLSATAINVKLYLAAVLAAMMLAIMKFDVVAMLSILDLGSLV